MWIFPGASAKDSRLRGNDRGGITVAQRQLIDSRVCGNDKGNNGKSNTARCRLAKNLTSIPFGRKLSGAYHSTLCVSNSLGAELFETKTG